MLKLKNIHFSYGSKKILDNLSFALKKNEILALIGASGSGKTTVFRLISGSILPDQGEIQIEGQPHLASCVTYMRQDDLLLPWRTVLKNLLLLGELGVEKKNMSKLEEEAKHLLSLLGLASSFHAFPHELSGGMRQRVSLARALLQNRPLLLLDEPFASLDLIIREQLYALLRRIRDEYDKTIILVTHDFKDAISLADRILILRKGQIGANFEVQGNEETLAQKIREQLLL